jgi:transcription-repair coupling factor (superfamily II helicase)
MLPPILEFERLGAPFTALKEAVDGKKSCAVFYATTYARYHITQGLNRFFLLVTPDRLSAREAHAILNDYCGDVILLPEKEDVLLNAKGYGVDFLADRMNALTRLYLAQGNGAVISAEGLLQYLPSKQLFAESLLWLRKGEELNLYALCESLSKGGYRRQDAISEKGDFSLRGDLLDVWTVNNDLPVRVEFFGDTIESIRMFAPESQMSVKEIKEFIISSKTDLLLSAKTKENVVKRLGILRRQKDSNSRLKEIIDDLQEKLSLGSTDGSLQWVLPFVKDDLSTVLDYLPKGSVIAFDETKAVDDKLRLLINAHNARVNAFTAAGETTAHHKESILSRERLYEILQSHVKISFQQITSANPVFEPQALFNIKSLPVARYNINMEILSQDVKNAVQANAKVLIYTGDRDTADGLFRFFMDNDLRAEITLDAECDRNILLIPQNVSRGFNYPKEQIGRAHV